MWGFPNTLDDIYTIQPVIYMISLIQPVSSASNKV